MRNGLFSYSGLTFLSQPGYEWAAVDSSSQQTQHVYKWDHNTFRVFMKGFFALNIHEIMTTSWHGNTFPITGTLWGESNGGAVDSPHKGPVMWRFDILFAVVCSSCWQSSCCIYNLIIYYLVTLWSLMASYQNSWLDTQIKTPGWAFEMSYFIHQSPDST